MTDRIEERLNGERAKFVQIAFGGNATDSTLIALDESGRVWIYSFQCDEWVACGDERVDHSAPSSRVEEGQ